MTTPLQSRKILFQQGVTGALVTHPAEDVRLTGGGLWSPDALDAMKVRTGIVAGRGLAGAAPCSVEAGSGQLVIRPGRFVIQGSTALQGHYEGTIDQALTRTLSTAQVGSGLPGAGQFKAGRVIVRVYDQLYGDAKDGWAVEVHMGAAAATAGAAAYPTMPSSSLQLATFTVNSAGAITLGATLPSFTVPRGGVLPVDASENGVGAYTGQYRDHAVMGLQRWNGTAWAPPAQSQVTGKIWRTAGVYNVTADGFHAVPMDASRVSGGFTATTGVGHVLTVPVDGFYDVTGHVYVLSGGNFQAEMIVTRVRAGVNFDVLGAQAYKSARDITLTKTARVPLRAGDGLRLIIYPAGSNTQVYGVHELSGSWVEATFFAPLNGATPMGG